MRQDSALGPFDLFRHWKRALRPRRAIQLDWSPSFCGGGGCCAGWVLLRAVSTVSGGAGVAGVNISSSSYLRPADGRPRAGAPPRRAKQAVHRPDACEVRRGEDEL